MLVFTSWCQSVQRLAGLQGGIQCQYVLFNDNLMHKRNIII